MASLGPSLLFTACLKCVRVLHWAEGAAAPALISQARPISGRGCLGQFCCSLRRACRLQHRLSQEAHGTTSQRSSAHHREFSLIEVRRLRSSDHVYVSTELSS